MEKNNIERENLFVNRVKSNNYIEIAQLPSCLGEVRKTKINITKKKYRNYISEFRNTVKTEIPHYDLTLFEKNIKTICFKEEKLEVLDEIEIENGMFTMAGLRLPENYMYLPKKCYSDNIFHELFHESNFIIINNIIYCGFSQHKSNLKVGQAINEGYTNLMKRRYFGSNEIPFYNYELEVLLVTMIEEIVGREKMENLYSRADLYGLVKELTKYNTEEKAINFIRNCDFVCATICVCKEKNNTDEIQRRLIFAISFLIESFCIKVKKMVLDNKIEIGQAKEICTEFAGVFDISFNLNGIVYPFATKTILDKIFVKIFPESNIIVENEAQVVSKTKRLIQRFLNKK